MRRDLGFYVEAKIADVYQAYLNAATHAPFDRDCKEEPFHTISFGMNFSMRYNMNGGSCNLHFMPCGSGTAVNIRFVVAQLVGARYEAYAQELNKAMQKFLPVIPMPAKFNMDDFTKPENQVTPGTYRQSIPAAPVAAPAMANPAPMPAAQTQFVSRFCTNCGTPLSEGSRFCTQCGAAVKGVKPV